MSGRWRGRSVVLACAMGACAVGSCGIAPMAAAHSASDAYLTLTAEKGAGAGHAAAGRTVLHGQWDVALRDLDFVMGLDDDGDGRLTWKEIHAHSAAIERYVYPHLRFVAGAGAGAGDGSGAGAAVRCTVHPTRAQIDEHADGAYAALFFDVICAAAPQRLQLQYDLFFAIDPSHRGIYVMRNGEELATAVLSPDNAKIDITI